MQLTVDSGQLPVGWIKTKLGDVCTKVEYGSSAKSKTEGEIPVLRMGNIQNGVIDWNDLVYTTDQEEIDKYLLKYNDILFNRTNSAEHVGKTAIYKGERQAIFAGYLIRIHYKEDLIDADFLNYYLNSNTVREYGKSVMSRSVNQANINGTKLKDYPILLPPLPEQQRIVAILDEAFEGIDRAITNTEKNLANASELFESSLQFIFSSKGKNWEKLHLSELLERKWITSHLDGNHGGDYPKKKEFVTSGVPYISANCLKNGSVDISLAKYLTPEHAALLRKGIAQNNDVLFAHNATVGPVAILRTNQRKIILSTSLTYYRCAPEYIIPEYLALYMRSNEFKLQYKAVMRQSTRNQVPITKQRTFYHIIPPIEEQQEIANHLDGLSIEVQRLKTIYHQKIAALNELKQSILQKAFTGELTADTANQTTKAAQEVNAA